MLIKDKPNNGSWDVTFLLIRSTTDRLYTLFRVHNVIIFNIYLYINSDNHCIQPGKLLWPPKSTQALEKSPESRYTIT